MKERKKTGLAVKNSTKKNLKNSQLSDRLISKPKSAWLQSNEIEKKEIFSFCEDYKLFLNKVKTERLAVKEIISTLKKEKFVDIATKKIIKKGDKIYLNWKEKVVLACVVGEDSSILRIIGSHVDSPRLDLKPKPFIEDSELTLLKTHYYGGIKKYHWVNQPLSLYGVIFTKEGKKIELEIGNSKDDGVFVIPDLLPHLSKNQYEKTPAKIIEGEQLSILFGGMPVDDKDLSNGLKLAVLEILNKKYGLIEEDFFTAEISLVPAQEARDVGLDKSMIGAYGQDDKVCVYTSLCAITKTQKPKHTAITFFVDKEETGSDGDTGAQSYILRYFMNEYIQKCSLNISVDTILAHAKAISADVTSALDPNHKDVYDITNSSLLGRGISIEKYGGGGGKYSTNDASAEFLNEIRQLVIKNNIAWQTGELGKIDIGGGGTIAKYLSRYGMSCIDAGPALLGIHSPFEISSKIDVYNAYKFYKAFFNS